MTHVVDAVVQRPMGRFERKAHSLLGAVFSAGAYCIQINHGTLDLVQDSDAIRGGQQRRAFHHELEQRTIGDKSLASSDSFLPVFVVELM